MPFFLIKPLISILSILLILGTLGFCSYRYGYKNGSEDVQNEWTVEKNAVLKAQQEQLLQKEERERQLQHKMDKLRVERQREINDLNLQLDVVLNQLRSRPDRTTNGSEPVSGDSKHGANQSGCTGDELYKSDAEFLIREAERADQLRLSLKRCEAAYDSARSKQ